MKVQELFDLTGKVALVTGGTRGIGSYIAEALGEMGARVMVTARDRGGLDEAVASLEAAGVEAAGVEADLDDGGATSVERILAATRDRFGTIDILVNNAGRVFSDEGVDARSLEAWRQVMRLNVDAGYMLSSAVANEIMIPRKSGKIVNISSLAGLGGMMPNSPVFAAAYHASKGAVIAMTRLHATQWGPHNINVNAICPGYFPTQLSAGLAGIAQEILDRTPLGRPGLRDDMKGVVAFLASEASRHVTGQLIPVDGGATAVVC